MFISNKEKESIITNVKYLLEESVCTNKAFLSIIQRLEKLEKASKPAPKKRGRPPVAQPKKRGRPPKAKNA